MVRRESCQRRGFSDVNHVPIPANMRLKTGWALTLLMETSFYRLTGEEKDANLERRKERALTIYVTFLHRRISLIRNV